VPLISKFTKAWRILKEEGIVSLLKAMRGYKYYCHRSIWFCIPLDDKLHVIPPSFDGWLDFDNPQRVLSWIERQAIPGTNDRAEIAKMKERNHLFVGIMNRDEIVGYVKLGWQNVYVMDYGGDLELPDGDYFIIDIYVSPEMRGHGGAPFALTAAAAAMKQRGFKRCVLHVRTDKLPMFKAGAKAGVTKIGKVTYRSALGVRIFRPHPQRFLY
jgi:RimJ/RimL family protein N-acetyltransferase